MVNYINSPSEGVVKNVDNLGNFWRVGIFLPLAADHTQYMVYNGVLIKQTYKPGKFHPAYLLEKSEYNERNIMLFYTENEEIVIEQIAGVIARKIRTFISVGDRLVKGQKIGKILLGSKVNCSFRSEIWKPLVKPGQKIDKNNYIAQLI